MTASLWLTVFVVLALLAIFAGSIVLQVYLSRKPEWWRGLMLPAVTFTVWLVVFTASLLPSPPPAPPLPPGSEPPATTQEDTTAALPGTDANTDMVSIVFVLIVIPTVSWLATYAVCRVSLLRHGDKNRDQDAQ